MVSTHDKIMAPCIQTTKLIDIWDYKDLDSHFNEKSDRHIKLRTADVILINEGQFFEDLYEVVVDMLKSNKRIYICGLDSDFERKKFGQMLDLIPLCDKVNKLNSLCSQCKNGTPGIFSMRLTSEKQQTLVGSDNYIPVCRKCYENKK
jgi:thymidine kinase